MSDVFWILDNSLTWECWSWSPREGPMSEQPRNMSESTEPGIRILTMQRNKELRNSWKIILDKKYLGFDNFSNLSKITKITLCSLLLLMPRPLTSEVYILWPPNKISPLRNLSKFSSVFLHFELKSSNLILFFSSFPLPSYKILITKKSASSAGVWPENMQQCKKTIYTSVEKKKIFLRVMTHSYNRKTIEKFIL